MKKYCLAASLCLASLAGFCQTHSVTIHDKARDPKTIEMAAVADTTLVDKKAIVDDSKKKKPRREKTHKECSRMKS